MEITLDKLRIKRLESIDEKGTETFPRDMSYDEKRESLIRRIDFAFAVEKEDEEKKAKKLKSSSSETPFPWQTMLENLQMAHQELSVIIDLINTVEANDSLTVAGMNRPKPLPNEILSDLTVSTANKLQSFHHLGDYFKQSAEALEQQVTRESRFYNALIRLQKNWKVKRPRVMTPLGHEGFVFDLSDSTATGYRPSSSAIRIDHGSFGMLAIKSPLSSYHSLGFGFTRQCSMGPSRTTNVNASEPITPNSVKDRDEMLSDDEKSIKRTHSLLRKVHTAIFAEQVFSAVNRGAFSQFLGANVNRMQENYLELSIGVEDSMFLSLVPLESDSCSRVPAPDSCEEHPEERREMVKEKGECLPNPLPCKIYVQQMVFDLFLKPKRQLAHERNNFSAHFCMSASHRLFSNRVLEALECLVLGVPFLELRTCLTWHSRISAWKILLNPVIQTYQKVTDSTFQTKVVVFDESVCIEAEGVPDAVGLLHEASKGIYPTGRIDIPLADLPLTLLHQVASQIISWLHKEACMLGVKPKRDFLSLWFKSDADDVLTLIARVDGDTIVWCLVIESGPHGVTEDDETTTGGRRQFRKYLGSLSLDMLYSLLMDFVILCHSDTQTH